MKNQISVLIAGMSAARHVAMRSRRRGSFIVLVVGTLAMLSIIMIVYVAVGNSDKRTSSAIVRRDKSGDVITTFSDYVAQIIADDAVTLVSDPSNTNSDGTAQTNLPGGLLYLREAWDAPATSWQADSTIALTTEVASSGIPSPKVFRAIGLGDDPWLASTTPVWLNFNAGSITSAPDGKEKTFRNRRDWLHITNISPDGRFVNLFNLRDNFNAEPGTGNNRMSRDLSLPDRGNLAQNAPLFGGTLEIDKPAMFDSWQAEAFTPARGPFIRNGSPITPNQAFYPPYQWADADGDGWFDSRWFELSDARGQNGANPASFRSLLPADPSMRWFFAARIIDLSSLVNVNTAGDMSKDPNQGTIDTLINNKYKTDVVGLSPTDVDLRRLLLMGDSSETVLSNSPATDVLIFEANAKGVVVPPGRPYAGGYSNFRQPVSGTSVMQDYTKYVPDMTVAGLTPPFSAALPGVNDPAIQLGEGAYRALRGGLLSGKAPSRFTNFSVSPLDTQAVNFSQIRDRRDYYNYYGGVFARPVYDSTTKQFSFGTGFRIDSLVELLTYRGVNDPATASSLEAAMGGRLTSRFGIEPTLNDPTVPYSPLRDNRSIELEREGMMITQGAGRGTPTDAALLKSFADVRQYLTTQSGARPLASNFYRPNTTETISFDNPPALVNKLPEVGEAPSINLRSDLTHFILKGADKNIDNSDIVNPLKYFGVPRTETLFAGYAAALMPGFPAGMTEDAAGDLVQAWTPGNTASSLRGLFYGHQGPMTALLASGHMTANFMSNFSRPPHLRSDPALPFYLNDHLPYTLILNEGALASTILPETPRRTTDSGVTPDSDWKKFFPSWWASWRAKPGEAASQTNQAFPTRQLNLARTQHEKSLSTTDRPMPRLATTQADMPIPAANLYGAGDLHPFIVEVASFTVYRDIPDARTEFRQPRADLDPENKGGDSEIGEMLPGSSSTNSVITLNGNITTVANGDLMFQAVAVKVHNPHAQPIALSNFDPVSGLNTLGTSAFQLNNRSDFYVQIGADPDPSKADTRTFFALVDAEEAKGGSGGAYEDTFSVKPVVIMPGESIVFYALNWTSHAIMSARLGNYDRDLVSSTLGEDSGVLEAWLDRQLAPKAAPAENGVRRVQMLRADANFDKVNQASFATFGFGQLFPNVEDLSNVPDQTVMLKRPIRANSGTLGDDSSAGSANIVWNDQLCDRFRLGKEIGLSRRLLGKQPDIQALNNDTIAMQDFTFPSSPNNQERGRNRRFTVTIGVNIRRSGDPALDKWKPGAIPVWALDAKDSPVVGTNADLNWYDVQFVPDLHKDLAPTQTRLLTLTDLAEVNGAQFWGDTPRIWREKQSGGTGAAIFPTLGKKPTEYPVRKRFLTDKNTAGQTFDEARREFTSNPFQFQGVGLTTSSGIVTNNPDGISQIRPTDLLNVMAIGCLETPVQDLLGTEITDTYQRWTTTSEMLAIAMNYATKPVLNSSWATAKNTGSSTFRYGPLDYYYFQNLPSGAPEKPMFDGGYLRTDAFVPVRFDSTNKPHTAGIGAPIAGNVLSMFRMNKDAFGALTSATSGLVNINTAPQAVLRVLPFTFPARDYATPPTNTTAFWLGNAVSEAQQTDVAAMIESYRDKFSVQLRPGARNRKPQQSWFAGFFDRNAAEIFPANKQNVLPTDPSIGDYSVGSMNQYKGGRFWTTGIEGLREGPGFCSVGELLAVRHIALDANGVPTTAAGYDLSNNIDFIGHRALDQRANLLGMDNNFWVKGAVDAANGIFKLEDVEPLEVGHTYQDKLKILSGLLGSVTVRSDMYAVWFIARGYQRSDCEGLPDLQPMVPTVERRFLMIIDRSNVTKIGQKPRVLAFVEVPL